MIRTWPCNSAWEKDLVAGTLLRILCANDSTCIVFGTFSPTCNPAGTDVLVASLPRLRQISALSDELKVLAVSANAVEDENAKNVQSAIFEALRRNMTVLLN